jgi:hypothetical protein
MEDEDDWSRRMSDPACLDQGMPGRLSFLAIARIIVRELDFLKVD